MAPPLRNTPHAFLSPPPIPLPYLPLHIVHAHHHGILLPIAVVAAVPPIDAILAPPLLTNAQQTLLVHAQPLFNTKTLVIIFSFGTSSMFFPVLVPLIAPLAVHRY